MSNFEAGSLASLSEAVTQLVTKSAAGVVAIKTAAYRSSSGVWLDNDLIATCHHAIKQDDGIAVVASNGAEFRASVLGRVQSLDLAILKAEAGAGTALAAADLTSLQAGALVAAVGWTLDVGASASVGVLGAVGGARRSWRGGMLDHFLRLDINLYPSQTGGAVVDHDGKLIGLATPALSRYAGMAVPVDTVQRVAEELRKVGRIRRGYIGVAVQEVPVPEALRVKLQDDTESGLMLLSVEAGSPAEQAGLQMGDILVRVDGKATGDLDQLQDALRGGIGQALEVRMIRGGTPVTAAITVGERPVEQRRGRRGH